MRARSDDWSESELSTLLLAVTSESVAGAEPVRLPAHLVGRPAGRLIARAVHHNVARALYASPGSADLAKQDRAELQAHCVTRVAHQMRAISELASIARALDRAGVPWLLIKGPVVAELLYSKPNLRAYADLDVVVPAPHFEEAIASLEAAGAVLIDANWQLLLADMRGQVHLRMPHGSTVDLHWHVLNRGLVRDSFSVSTQELFARSREVLIAGLALRTLDPSQTLLHLCLHAALSGGDRLSWLKDIDRAAVAEGLSWDAVVGTARRWRARLAVGALLVRARGALGTPVPAAVVGELVPPGWRAALRALDRAAPVSRTRRDLSVLGVSTPLLRDRGVGVSPRMLRALPTGYREATRDRRIDQTGQSGDGPADRQRYLSAVARSDS